VDTAQTNTIIAVTAPTFPELPNFFEKKKELLSQCLAFSLKFNTWKCGQ
jgi:hypothetical protein